MYTYSFAGKHGTLGKEFVFNFIIPWNTNLPPTVMISTPSTNPVSFNISVPGLNFYKQGSVTQEQHSETELPKETYLSLLTSVQDKTVMVTADGEISVFGINSRGTETDGFMALPTHALGKKYMVLTYGPEAGYNYPCLLSFSALGEKTDVHVTLPDQQQISITLKAYQSYQIYDRYSDLSGSVVESNKTIAVMAGVEITSVPRGVLGDDGLVEMLPSVDSFGQNFVLAPFKGRERGYFYRIITPTKVKINVTKIGLVDLDAGKIYDGDVSDDSITLISSDNPVQVMQYMKGTGDGKGDVAMVTVPPTELFAKNVIFPVYNCPIFNDYKYFINIIAQCSDRQGLMFDETALDDDFDTISEDGMCAFRSEVTFGTHNVDHTDTDVTFSVVVYGFRKTNSYAYSAGFNVIAGEFIYKI